MLWKKLKHFWLDYRARAVVLTNEYLSCRNTEREIIGLHTACLRQLVNQIKDPGAPVAECYQSFQVIRYLPEEFSRIIQNIYC
ncbi:uncharacterized protein CEXT_582391 [Caerostris extrusa]|uniref:Uncharacterized protein n=1 Tax=Caerostris extrusa TaxID=172846 RepID=A0AAV4QKY2_CAEEX|nr:uncharacterized protein CEXT_582391 [Caerostris extrusa]